MSILQYIGVSVTRFLQLCTSLHLYIVTSNNSVTPVMIRGCRSEITQSEYAAPARNLQSIGATSEPTAAHA